MAKQQKNPINGWFFPINEWFFSDRKFHLILFSNFFKPYRGSPKSGFNVTIVGIDKFYDAAFT